MATNYCHLSKEQRNNIEHLLNKSFNFTDIGEVLKVDRTTISKEVRRNRYLKNSIFSPHSEKGIKRAIKACDKLSKPPYCCNSCKLRNSCILSHLYYNAKEAQRYSDKILTESRQGVDITQEEIYIINKNIVPLIKNKNQSVNQVFINHPDILYFSKTTFYKYVNEKVILLSNFDLPRKVKYKKRKKKNKNNKRDYSILNGRRYEDYLDVIKNNSKLKTWQLDTVIGKSTDKKCLMTFMLVETNFMLIRLLDKKDIENINKEFTLLKENLGIDLYKQFIEIILTDNGSEFYDPLHMEIDLNTGEKISSVYYCHPNSPEEKAELEKNHEYIRYVLPKKTSFENLSKEVIKKLEDNINNIPREILGNKSPYDLTKDKYPELIQKLNSKYIKPDNVSLNRIEIIGDNHEK